MKGPSADLQILSVWSYLFSWYSFLYSCNLGFLGLSTPSPQLWRSSGLFLNLLSLHYGNSLKVVYIEAIIGLILLVSLFSRVTLLCCLMFSILKYTVLYFFVYCSNYSGRNVNIVFQFIYAKSNSLCDSLNLNYLIWITF